jgi:mono/diheme cytochrome c family protein
MERMMLGQTIIQFSAWAFVGPALLVFFLSSPPLAAAPKAPNGAKIYREHCVRCHGKNGEGVKSEYAEALHGDWSLEKLTRYIEKSMPEDDPGKVKGPDAAAVAQYISDTFYSREARARHNPARVELARLTNRQYVNTVADLLAALTESKTSTATEGERGLRGNYRPRNRGETNRLANFERVDRGIQFTFGPGTPDEQALGTGTNEFSITWRGSLLARESGDHEFILKTPNGARLWVNDEETPVIDASVASGDNSGLQATRRLLAGRSYPLRLEYFKAPKDKTAAIALRWKPPHGTEEVIPARQLRTGRSAPTFVVTTPFPPDDSSVGYERGVGISKAWDEATTQAAIEVANHVLKNVDQLSDSKLKDTNRTAKVQAFAEQFVTKAFRRPLTPRERRDLVAAHFRKTARPEDGLKRVILLALKSPHFLYLGLTPGQPDDFTVASRLSYGLWDSLPDVPLLEAAARGGLRSATSVQEQARRMLNDPRARAKMQYFLHHWLQMSHVDDLSKDTKLYPGFTAEIIADLRTSLDLFLEDVVWADSSDYRRLLLEDDLFLNPRLAAFYGVSTNGNAADDFSKVSLDPKQRSGVLTHPYLLAAFSYQRSSSPIHRGVFLTRNIVGRALKPPPIAVAFNEAEFKPDMTMREKVAELTRSDACQTCHSVINPLGFSLEHYDAVGRFRTEEGDRPIDAVSEYMTDDGAVVKLTGARGVAEFGAGREHAQEAFIENLFHQVVKQPMLAYGTDVPDRLRYTFTRSGFNIRKLLVEIATIAALHNPSTSANKRL